MARPRGRRSCRRRGVRGHFFVQEAMKSEASGPARRRAGPESPPLLRQREPAGFVPCGIAIVIGALATIRLESASNQWCGVVSDMCGLKLAPICNALIVSESVWKRIPADQRGSLKGPPQGRTPRRPHYGGAPGSCSTGRGGARRCGRSPRIRRSRPRRASKRPALVQVLEHHLRRRDSSGAIVTPRLSAKANTRSTPASG